MESKDFVELFNRFEAIANDCNGVECWSARELAVTMGYTQYRNFLTVVEKAKESCHNAGEPIFYHFVEIIKTIEVGLGIEREVDDVMLTRYACYLVAQNGDPRKTEIAFAQNYFAVQTRRAEIIQKRLLEHERVQARAKLAETEKRLSGVLYERGIDSKGFALIRSKGDQALFNLDTALLKRKLGVPSGRPLADFLPTVNIKAKDLAAEMTAVNVNQKDLRGQKPIEKEHIDNNVAVRKVLLKRNIVPEELPAAEDVTKVARRLKANNDKGRLKGEK